MGAASKSTSMEYVPSAPESSKVPIAPMGKLLTRLPRLTLAQLRTLRSSTGCTCCRDLAKFPSPPWETHVLLVFTGRRCLCLFRHRHNDVLLDHRQHSFWIGACSCGNFPSPRWENAHALALTLACPVLKLCRTCDRDLNYPNAPMGKCFVDMSLSILIFYDGCCLQIYQLGVRATAPESSKVAIAPMGKLLTHLL